MIYDSLIRGLLGVRSQAGPQARLTILIFHRVLSSPDPLFPGEPDTSRFDAIVSWLVKWFNVIPLQEAAEHLRNGTLSGRTACITFDDGYADNVQNAMPILQKQNFMRAGML